MKSVTMMLCVEDDNDVLCIEVVKELRFVEDR